MATRCKYHETVSSVVVVRSNLPYSVTLFCRSYSALSDASTSSIISELPEVSIQASPIPTNLVPDTVRPPSSASPQTEETNVPTAEEAIVKEEGASQVHIVTGLAENVPIKQEEGPQKPLLAGDTPEIRLASLEEEEERNVSASITQAPEVHGAVLALEVEEEFREFQGANARQANSGREEKDLHSQEASEQVSILGTHSLLTRSYH